MFEQYRSDFTHPVIGWALDVVLSFGAFLIATSVILGAIGYVNWVKNTIDVCIGMMACL